MNDHPLTSGPDVIDLDARDAAIQANPDLQPFDEGVLCYVVLRRYRGTGAPKLILHKANAELFTYGNGTAWTADARGLKKK